MPALDITFFHTIFDYLKLFLIQSGFSHALLTFNVPLPIFLNQVGLLKMSFLFSLTLFELTVKFQIVVLSHFRIV